MYLSNKRKPPPFYFTEKSSVLLATPRGQGRGRTVIPGFAVQYISIMLPSHLGPATSCAKVKRLFFLPRSLFFYICGGGRSALYDRRRVTREEGTTSFSLDLLNLPYLIESCKPLNYWLVQRRPEGGWLLLYVCSGEEHDEASVLVATMPI